MHREAQSSTEKKQVIMKHLISYLICFFAFYFCAVSNAYSEQSQTNVASPNNSLHLLLGNNNGRLTMAVTMNGKRVIDPSPLVMSVDGFEITSGIKTGKVKRYNVDETFPLAGLHSVAKNHFNGLSVSLKHVKSGIRYTFEARVFNDAVAFRFIVPGDENISRVPDEATAFKLPAKSIVWFHDLYMHYEGVHTKKLVDTIPAGEWAAPPLTVKLPTAPDICRLQRQILLVTREWHSSQTEKMDSLSGWDTRILLLIRMYSATARKMLRGSLISQK